MRRLFPLLLLALPTLCWSAPQSEEDGAAKRGACVYARPMGEGGNAPQTRPPVPPAASSTGRATPGSGGGGDEAMPRGRASNKWHSFLPGMFR
ncbi:hypothetical protein [Pseudoxanthomonas taiwanensis]|jgi:hypothetical protein|uniref:Secreted protein n=1 Tax=Pseudoxanthomonas taiwanensis TaxID=176598 RepID=A0A921NYI5_9GAMM|nr:hypothetical protein [Pseudoxanthomonas taiwanensis]KAF1687071.1 hypothetical protein CR938_11785 [Pseudoxanthomonas taiwanensis]MBO2466993.1 hypothetical protein [Xanthomonadaceae bacterium]